MKNKYSLLTRNNKIIAWIIVIIVSLIVSFCLNRHYLQAKMFGRWTVIDSEINYGLEKAPKSITISSYKLNLGNKVIPIKYTSKSTRSTFKRLDEKNEIYYFFKQDSSDDNYRYMLIFNKEDTEKMQLLSFENSGDDGQINWFSLERSE
ncbi:hypothetical protein UAY_01331 [Enterococcus moraviensis ATCC BAA-383]|uniref:Uncharacterized protein n=1 Tax=Enterococcus moraviensis ATCC BAA-383 TaxID=1158609 RepID=R2TP52_9ENTE|nr:hypothetical protein [Enterococcus moraviensis]EOI01922.1 hypothetical protein UAY_01331 [Enterococcus moraviensis ATCC BAA-383]EOT73543.1 hypothetical protein I586_00536 [Enterococcus moraviensis ATCC BAA-383]